MLSPLQIDALDPCALLMVIFAAVLGGFWLAFVVYRASPASLFCLTCLEIWSHSCTTELSRLPLPPHIFSVRADHACGDAVASMFDGASIAMLVTMTIAYVLPAVYQRVPVVGPAIVAPDHCYHDHTRQVRISTGCWQPARLCLAAIGAMLSAHAGQPQPAYVEQLPSLLAVDRTIVVYPQQFGGSVCIL